MRSRRPIYTLLLALGLCLLDVPLRASAPTDGLVAYYPFNGNANDASGNQLHGTLTAVTPTDDIFGNTNSALFFDGVSSGVVCGNPAAFNFQSGFTLSAWIKLNGPQVNKYVLGKYDFPSSANSYGIGTSGNSQPYGFIQRDGPYQDVSAPTPSTMNDGKWHSIIFIYDAESIRIYRDGLLAGTTPVSPYPPFANSVPLTIGRIASGQAFSGSIDEVRIYNRPLNESELPLILPPPEITIVQQPQGFYAGVNAAVTLRIVATGTFSTEPLQYQWFKNGQPVSATATNSTLSVTSTTATEDFYKVQLRLDDLEQISDEVKVGFVQVGDAKLLAHYTFEADQSDVIFDATGNYHGNPENLEPVPGRVGKSAARFNGTNSWIQVPFPASPLDLAGTPYTIAFWLKAENKTTSQQLLWMGDLQDNFGGYSLSFTPTQFSSVHNHGIAGTAWNTTFRTTTNWQHIALVWNGFTRSLYTNGVLTASVSTTSAIVSERDDELYFGSRGGTNFFLRGSLDDIRIYSYALATDEIVQLNAAATTPLLSISRINADLVLQWPFIDGLIQFRVEFSPAVGPTADWQPAGGVPQRTGDTFSLTQTAPATTRFYRLRKL